MLSKPEIDDYVKKRDELTGIQEKGTTEIVAYDGDIFKYPILHIVSSNINNLDKFGFNRFVELTKTQDLIQK